MNSAGALRRPLRLAENRAVVGVEDEAILVRQTRGSPATSFGFHLTVDTLALGYALPAM